MKKPTPEATLAQRDREAQYRLRDYRAYLAENGGVDLERVFDALGRRCGAVEFGCRDELAQLVSHREWAVGELEALVPHPEAVAMGGSTR